LANLVTCVDCFKLFALYRFVPVIAAQNGVSGVIFE